MMAVVNTMIREESIDRNFVINHSRMRSKQNEREKRVTDSN